MFIGSCCSASAICAYDFLSKTRSESHTFQSAAYQYVLHKAMKVLGHHASAKLEKDSLNADKVQEAIARIAEETSGHDIGR